MTKKGLSPHYNTALTLCQVFISSIAIFAIFCAIFAPKTHAAEPDLDNFYFSDFTADYYLSKDASGASQLKVIENLTAVFPDYDQNRGICRQIPFTNQDGNNITLTDSAVGDIKTYRNGSPERLYSLEKYRTHYTACIRGDAFLHGTQKYTIEYTYTNVVTDFVSFQELYWDTNGNGWPQSFGSVAANIHLDHSIQSALDKDKACYVGKYGESGTARCDITTTSDGFSFRASDLKPFENLTFAIKLKPGTFTMPTLEKSYAAILILLGVAAVSIFCVSFPIKTFKKTKEKRDFYKNCFIKPEYQPHKDYQLAEVAEVFISKNKKDARTGVLLDMIVNKKITIKKDKKGLSTTWTLTPQNVEALSATEKLLLQVLNRGKNIENGQEIELKTQTATPETVTLGERYNKSIIKSLQEHKLVDSKYLASTSAIKISAILIIIGFTTFVSIMLALPDGNEKISKMLPTGVDNIGAEIFPAAFTIIINSALFIILFLRSQYSHLLHHTKKGLEVSRYMDGLKLYIEKAESARINFLQSVGGVDTSPSGIVKLHEKLLPYAALFGLEKSWMKELEKYYKLADISSPDWYVSGITTTELLRGVSTASGYAYSSGHISGGGGFSSSSSGSGGGGFSGGGGGGGGGGGC